MRKSKFTDEPTAFSLKQAELGISVEQLRRKMGISDAISHVWRRKYGRIGPSDLRRLRQLEVENRKLKHIVAHLCGGSPRGAAARTGCGRSSLTTRDPPRGRVRLIDLAAEPDKRKCFSLWQSAQTRRKARHRAVPTHSDTPVRSR